jgi:hypothetical protein
LLLSLYRENKHNKQGTVRNQSVRLFKVEQHT